MDINLNKINWQKEEERRMNNNVQIDLTQCRELNRREAMLTIRAGEEVVCRLIRSNMKPDILILSTMAQVITEEQRGICDKVELYKQK